MALERRLTVPPDVGQAGFMGALLNGVAGLLSEPIRCGALPECIAWSEIPYNCLEGCLLF
jgi:hypothetical protein